MIGKQCHYALWVHLPEDGEVLLSIILGFH